MTSVLLVLCLSANTSFADFPRVCRLLAEDGYLSEAFASRGARLVYCQGIVVLAVLSGILLVVFSGITDALIPLFAVGVFSAFTLSQLGMVVHWRRRQRNVIRMLFNAAGAVATAATLAIIITAKFLEGAWLTLIVIPAGYGFFLYTQRVYARTTAQLSPTEPLDTRDIERPIAIVPIDRIDKAATPPRDDWERLVAEPARRSGRDAPELG